MRTGATGWRSSGWSGSERGSLTAPPDAEVGVGFSEGGAAGGGGAAGVSPPAAGPAGGAGRTGAGAGAATGIGLGAGAGGGAPGEAGAGTGVGSGVATTGPPGDGGRAGFAGDARLTRRGFPAGDATRGPGGPI